MKFAEADSGLATLLCLAVLLRCQRVFLQQRKGTDLKMFFFMEKLTWASVWLCSVSLTGI